MAVASARYASEVATKAGMKWSIATAIALLLVASWALAANDLFLRPDSFFAAPGGTITIRVLNGAFSKSENAVGNDRLQDLTVVGPAGVTHPDVAAWDDYSDTTTSFLDLRVGATGTYLIGASVRPRDLMVEAKDFDAYLAANSIPDVLAARRKNKDFLAPVRERYSKHVKTIVQVGDRRTETYRTILDYPAELIPLDNPYRLRPDGTMRVRALVDGAPVANQLVIAGGQTPSGSQITPRFMRTDRAGIVRVRLSSRGAWYVRFIHMERATADTTIDYESKWATLTFGLR
jgi:hypothetical protein